MFHARSLSLRRIGPPDVPRLTLTYFWSQEGLLQTSTVGSFPKTERAEKT